nr:RHS repeat-associated core domain-containing protein [Trinickia sp. Y13]
MRFQGRQEDAETGLRYTRNRYYDPSSGRFVSQDPIKLRVGINIYAYGANPIGWADPLGLAGSSLLALPAPPDPIRGCPTHR